MNLSELDDTAIEYILNNMDASHLNQWEQGFLISITERWDRIKHLTPDQKLCLGRIWDKQP